MKKSTAPEMKETTSIQKLAYGVTEAAECMSISRSQLYVLIRNGQVKITKIGGRTVIAHQALVNYLQAS